MAVWWRRYWLAPGGRHGVAIVRVALAFSILWTLYRMGQGGYVGAPADAPAALYRARGLWLLYPGTPAPALIEALRALAWAATFSMLIGLGARASHALSLVATLLLATYDVAFTPTWSHHNSLPLLAHLAFLGARGGDAFSVDAWWRARRGLPPHDAGAGYQWSLRLVLVAIAVPFFAAACFKLFSGRGSLDWALSDNLRHQLLARFDRIGAPRTAVADWLMAEPSRWKTAALLNLVAQLAPIVAVLAIRRPWVRLVCGALWCTEVLGLGVVMDLWNLHWLPLSAAFVMWDRPAPAPAGPPPRAPGVLAFVTVFVLVDLVHAFGLNQRTRLYPFSAFPMFGEIRARRPFDRHQAYEMIGGRVELVTTRPLTAAEQAWVDQRHPYRFMWQHRDPARLRQDLAGILAETRARFGAAAVRAVRLHLTTYVAPPYPAPARLVPVDLAVIAELDDAGGFRCALGRLDRDRRTVRVTAAGLDLTAARLVGFRDDRPAATPLDATVAPGALILREPLPGDPAYLAADVDGVRWLVAGRSRRGY